MKETYIGLNQKSNAVRILQISDTHFGKLDLNVLRDLAEVIHFYSPHYMVITGDIMDAEKTSRSKVEKDLKWFNHFLAQFTTIRRIVAVFGNHDRSNHVFIKKHLSNITFLDDQYFVDDHVRIFGSSDYLAGNRPRSIEESKDLFRIANDERKSILLAHNPDGAEEIIVNGEYGRTYKQQVLALCGHTHGGEIIMYPKIIDLIIKIVKLLGLDNKPLFSWAKVLKNTKYLAGLFRKNSHYIYVNSGLATHYIRIGVPPEVTIIDY